jgi:hypothetical protein
MDYKKAHLKTSNLPVYYALGLILLTFQIQIVHAESVSEVESEANKYNPWLLWAKPRICVVPSDRLICKMETDLGWSGIEQADICLSSSEKDAALHCWRDALKGHLAQNIITEKQITYWLNRAGEEEVLVKTQIRIISFPKKQVRRRRRHIWSLL